MRVLIVHAHPEPRSFTSAMRDVAERVLTSQGHSVVVSDLYQMGFDPVASAADFSDRANPDYLVYALEQRNAYAHGSLRADIRQEVEKLLACDLLVLSFPIYWFSVPAILKGWIDRVFLSGPCYGGKRLYDRGGLRGKQALVTASMGARPHMFGRDAVHGELNDMLRHLLRGTLAYVGFGVLEPYIAYHVPYVDDVQRRAILSDYEVTLTRLGQRPMIAFPSLAQFDDRLRPMPGP